MTNLDRIDSRITLNNGLLIPVLGLGVYKSGSKTYDAVRSALDIGYRRIDTASLYENEEAVGRAIIDSGLKRKDVFITTKIWNTDIRSGKILEACERSLELLNTDYIDLYLMHWPVPDKYVAAYCEMEKLLDKKLIKALGVSNFLIPQLDNLLPKCNIVPALNQIETHPYLTNVSLIDYCIKHNITPEAWAPICRGTIISDPVILSIADKYSRTPTQIVLRWHLQRQTTVIPKSVNQKRIAENSKIFDFTLDDADMDLIYDLNSNHRTGPDPANFDF
ncbi:MAG: aldo/keto reductase [Christensenellaceae bacterium]|jgi:diketogulonate reductase-like aldo/keto reductase|nr:aldo/keto reductase [Christensenellaceae bacterium]